MSEDKKVSNSSPLSLGKVVTSNETKKRLSRRVSMLILSMLLLMALIATATVQYIKHDRNKNVTDSKSAANGLSAADEATRKKIERQTERFSGQSGDTVYSKAQAAPR